MTKTLSRTKQSVVSDVALKHMREMLCNPENELTADITRNGAIKIKGRAGNKQITAYIQEFEDTGIVAEKRLVSEAPQHGDPDLPEKARKLREKGLTQAQIGEILGRSQSAISGYLR